jgi:formate hydrogenlyase subunit 3/multisubunit Na+/H+ antiporter MnhD subunit
MTWLLASLVLLVASGLAALLTARRPALSAAVGAWGAMAGCLAGLVAAAPAFGGRAVFEIHRPWMSALGGAFHLAMDDLSGFFLVPAFLICGVAALFGWRYLAPAREGARVGGAWLFYNLLVAAIALVLTARNALLFLVAWEVMALASFFLVVHEHGEAEVRRAGRVYLIATHLGTAFLTAFMLLMARSAGSLEFADWRHAGAGLPAAASAVLFACALIGFGTKAGFMPLHVWLPEAHPAAPSHVSAVMSAVMIKTGLYGLLRLLPCLGPPAAWWGWVFVGVGLSSGVLGIVFALAQRDLKRLLAYSSVENVGIVALGIGVGLLGLHHERPLVAVLGFAGALLHIVNHALFKALLFLGAGAACQAAHTRQLDALGGLLRRMPVTGPCVLIGATAICGLPPLNGFPGEFLIYAAGFLGLQTAGPSGAALLLAVVAGLAMIGGLALACFAKLFGIVFLGEPRVTGADGSREVDRPMRVALVVLAACCGGLGVALPAMLAALRPAVAAVTGLAPGRVAELTAPFLPACHGVAAMAGLVVAAALALVLLRRRLLAGREVRQAVTWDCGYARPTARMQYTASSFAQPLVDLFSLVLRSRRTSHMAPGLFPASASLETETRDVFSERVYTPGFRLVDRWTSLLKWLQSGRVQLYILYIVIVLMGLLFWTLGRGE